MQLNVLAAENAALRAKLTEREQAAQLDMQDLRKFCIASQARDSEKDSPAYKELQQQQQQMMSQLSNVESLANQANTSTVHISTRLDKVMQCCNAHQAPVNSQSSSCIKASWKLLSSHLRCHSHKRKRSSGYGYVVVSCIQKHQLCTPQTLLQADLC